MSAGLGRLILAALGALCLLASVGGRASEPSPRPVLVTLVRSRAATAYDEAARGLEDGLRGAGLAPAVEDLLLDEDPAVTVAAVAARPATVVVTLGSRATLALRGKTRAPLVFSMVLDPAASGLPAAGSAAPDVTGVTLDIPPSRQLDAVRQVLPRARRVGILHSAASLKLVAEAQAAAAPLGLTVVPSQIASEREIARALAALAPRMDVLLAVPDATVYTETSTRYILLQMLRQAQPLVGLMDTFVDAGALLAVGVDYGDLGRQTAAQVARIAAGEAPEAIPVEDPRTTPLLLNLKTARRLGITVPDAALAAAKVRVQ